MVAKVHQVIINKLKENNCSKLEIEKNYNLFMKNKDLFTKYGLCFVDFLKAEPNVDNLDRFYWKMESIFFSDLLSKIERRIIGNKGFNISDSNKLKLKEKYIKDGAIKTFKNLKKDLYFIVKIKSNYDFNIILELILEDLTLERLKSEIELHNEINNDFVKLEQTENQVYFIKKTPNIKLLFDKLGSQSFCTNKNLSLYLDYFNNEFTSLWCFDFSRNDSFRQFIIIPHKQSLEVINHSNSIYEFNIKELYKRNTKNESTDKQLTAIEQTKKVIKTDLYDVKEYIKTFGHPDNNGKIRSIMIFNSTVNFYLGINEKIFDMYEIALKTNNEKEKELIEHYLLELIRCYPYFDNKSFFENEKYINIIKNISKENLHRFIKYILLEEINKNKESSRLYFVKNLGALIERNVFKHTIIDYFKDYTFLSKDLICSKNNINYFKEKIILRQLTNTDIALLSDNNYKYTFFSSIINNNVIYEEETCFSYVIEKLPSEIVFDLLSDHPFLINAWLTPFIKSKNKEKIDNAINKIKQKQQFSRLEEIPILKKDVCETEKLEKRMSLEDLKINDFDLFISNNTKNIEDENENI